MTKNFLEYINESTNSNYSQIEEKFINNEENPYQLVAALLYFYYKETQSISHSGGAGEKKRLKINTAPAAAAEHKPLFNPQNYPSPLIAKDERHQIDRGIKRKQGDPTTQEIEERREQEFAQQQDREQAEAAIRVQAAQDVHLGILARQEAEQLARQQQAEQLARQEAEELARQQQAEELARQQAEELARQQAEELARQQQAAARQRAEGKIKLQTPIIPPRAQTTGRQRTVPEEHKIKDVEKKYGNILRHKYNPKNNLDKNIKDLKKLIDDADAARLKLKPVPTLQEQIQANALLAEIKTKAEIIEKLYDKLKEELPSATKKILEEIAKSPDGIDFDYEAIIKKIKAGETDKPPELILKEKKARDEFQAKDIKLNAEIDQKRKTYNILGIPLIQILNSMGKLDGLSVRAVENLDDRISIIKKIQEREQGKNAKEIAPLTRKGTNHFLQIIINNIIKWTDNIECHNKEDELLKYLLDEQTKILDKIKKTWNYGGHDADLLDSFKNILSNNQNSKLQKALNKLLATREYKPIFNKLSAIDYQYAINDEDEGSNITIPGPSTIIGKNTYHSINVHGDIRAVEWDGGVVPPSINGQILNVEEKVGGTVKLQPQGPDGSFPQFKNPKYIRDYDQRAKLEKFITETLDRSLNENIKSFLEIGCKEKCVISNAAFTTSNLHDGKASHREKNLFADKEKKICVMATLLDPAEFGTGGCDKSESERVGVYEYGNSYFRLQCGNSYYDVFIEIESPYVIKNLEVTCNLPSKNEEKKKSQGKKIIIKLEDVRLDDGKYFGLSRRMVYKKVLSVLLSGLKPVGTPITWKTLENNREFIINIINNLAQKGLGDLLQELTAALKFGGYAGSTAFPSPNYIPNNAKVEHYDGSGNAWRLFLANDRPSAARFLLMLLFFPQQNLNLKAVGGYLTKHEYLLITKDLEPAEASAAAAAAAAASGQAGPSGVPKTPGGGGRSGKQKIITKKKVKHRRNKKTRKTK